VTKIHLCLLKLRPAEMEAAELVAAEMAAEVAAEVDVLLIH
jgi:hypothetical protein